MLFFPIEVFNKVFMLDSFIPPLNLHANSLYSVLLVVESDAFELLLATVTKKKPPDVSEEDLILTTSFAEL